MIYAASSIDEKRKGENIFDEVEVRKAISRNHHEGPFHDSANAFVHAAKSHFRKRNTEDKSEHES